MGGTKGRIAAPVGGRGTFSGGRPLTDRARIRAIKVS